ncbi:MAG TPA: ATP-binding protein [Verrucomicrobiae bacterium]|nr:ATP-binding protein [Verrucomicrobiae bacterium]
MISRFQNLSIRNKQMVVIMLTSTVALLLACAGFVFYDALDFRQELVERIGAIARVIGEHSTASLDFSDPKTAEQTLAALGTEPEVVSGCIYDREGRVYAVFTRDSRVKFVPPPPEPDGHSFSGGRMHLFRRIVEGQECVGTIYVQAGLQELPKRLARYGRIAVIVFGVSLLVTLLISSRLQQLLSAPILSLAHLARFVAVEKNYSVRAEKQGHDELGQLIDGFNEMLAQIQQRDNALEAARETLENRVVARTNELARSISLLNATLNSTADGIVAINLSGRVICQNDKFAAMWDIPEPLLERADNEEIISHCAKKFENPDEFLHRFRELLGHPEGSFVDVLTLRDGRAFERTTHPQLIAGKCIGSVLTFHEITARKKAEANLQRAHAELVQASRHAGMAEVATNVLHNVGNVLNSVNTSASIVMDQVRASKWKGVPRMVELLEPHADDLGGFLTRDERGRQVFEYLKALSNFLSAEHSAMLAELNGLTKNIEHIKQIVSMQQSYAKASGVEEIHSPALLVEDALRIHNGALERHHVRLARDFTKVPDIVADKHKVLQILINLIGNAKYALTENGNEDRILTLGMRTAGQDRILISVADNGVGIARENLIRIFSHGFTTRKNGHGFGLHSGFLAAKEMGGSLSVESDGPGTGAIFTLELPVNTRSKS